MSERLRRKIERLERAAPPGTAETRGLPPEVQAFLERYSPAALAARPVLDGEAAAPAMNSLPPEVQEVIKRLLHGPAAAASTPPLRGIRPGEPWPDAVVEALSNEQAEASRAPAEPSADAPPTVAVDQATAAPADPLAALRRLWGSEG